MYRISACKMWLDMIFSVLILVLLCHDGKSSNENNIENGHQRNRREELRSHFFVMRETPNGLQATWDQTQSREHCQDKHPNCRMWGDHGECQYNPNYMVPNCPYTCNTCLTGVSNNFFQAQNNNNGIQGNNNNNNGAQGSNNNNQDDCTRGNTQEECDLVAREVGDSVRDGIISEAEAVLTSTVDTVNISASNATATRQGGYAGEEILNVAAEAVATSAREYATGCRDLSTVCPNLAAQGMCDTNTTFMYVNCPISCETCLPTEPSECVNREEADDDSCDLSAILGLCEVNFAYNLRFCAGSCKNTQSLRDKCIVEKTELTCDGVRSLRRPDFRCGVASTRRKRLTVSISREERTLHTQKREPRRLFAHSNKTKRSKKPTGRTERRNKNRKRANKKNNNEDNGRKQLSGPGNKKRFNSSRRTKSNLSDKTDKNEIHDTDDLPVKENITKEDNKEKLSTKQLDNDPIANLPLNASSRQGAACCAGPIGVVATSRQGCTGPFCNNICFSAGINCECCETRGIIPTGGDGPTIEDWVPPFTLGGTAVAITYILANAPAAVPPPQPPPPPPAQPPPPPPPPVVVGVFPFAPIVPLLITSVIAAVPPLLALSSIASIPDTPQERAAARTLLPFCDANSYLALVQRLTELTSSNTGQQLDPEVFEITRAINHCRHGVGQAPPALATNITIATGFNNVSHIDLTPPPDYPGVSHPGLGIGAVGEAGNITDNDRNRFFCGASLITTRHVLTAAHCVDLEKSRRPEVVRLGERDFETMDESLSADYDVKDIHIHPDYNILSNYNDIAIIELEDEVTEERSGNILPYCLPPDVQNLDNEICTFSGWGTRPNAPAATVLANVNVTVRPQEECNAAYNRAPSMFRLIFPREFDDTTLCAAGEEGQDACRGDSGGPLVFRRIASVAEEVGIVSQGVGCGDPDFPGIYTRTDAFLDWLDDVVYREENEEICS